MGIKGTVLYYTPERSERTTKLKSIFVRQGLRIRNIQKEEFNETVGYLAGIKGYEKTDQSQEEREIPVEVLVMKGFTSRQIDDLLLAIRKAGLSKIDLKAIITDQNAGWTFFRLYEEIKKEHEKVSGKTRQ